MTDKELLYIKTIAEEHNITKAAEKLHVAQPSLTQCIKRIEKSLDCPLFYRKKTGLVLTDGGKLYYETACRAGTEDAVRTLLCSQVPDACRVALEKLNLD